MTRARDHLVLSLHRKGRDACHAKSIAEVLGGAPYLPLDDLAAPDDPAAALEDEVEAPVRARRPVAADPARRQRWMADRQSALARAARPASVAATTIARLAGVAADGAPGGVAG